MKYYALVPVLVFLALQTYLMWCRAGNGGKVGRAIRRSDYHAWEMAVKDQRNKIDDHMATAGRIPRDMNWRLELRELEDELAGIIEAKPRMMPGDFPDGYGGPDAQQA